MSGMLIPRYVTKTQFVTKTEILVKHFKPKLEVEIVTGVAISILYIV